ncbi:MAG TPA: sigma-54 dependent transcriptional regulator [Bdellovibrionales bacterium]|nr:sigma-54 dependent transcriptional regulator [Bdellovibrionales bacterium]
MTAAVERIHNTKRVLVVDDESHQRAILTEAITDLGYKVTALASPAEALDRLRKEYHDVVVTDMQMPGMTGLELLARIREWDPTIGVIVVTAHGTIETAVEAMRNGAEDYVQKPVEFGALEIALTRVFEKRALVRENLKLQNENTALRRDIGIKYHLGNAIGTSPAAKELIKSVENFSKTREIVLVLGEAGTGKTDIARMIHYNSPWAPNPLLLFDCASVPLDLHEAHLFGEETAVRGGSKVPGYAGLVEKAHMGTLVVSNVHLLSRKCQSRLSGVVRDHVTQRTGGSQNYYADIRLIATSSPGDVEKLMEGRWDLYHFLMENTVVVPRLRDRKEDIPLLALAVARRMSAQYGKSIETLDRALTEMLAAHDFPGNYSELESMIETAVLGSTGTVLKAEHLTFTPRKRA